MTCVCNLVKQFAGELAELVAKYPVIGVPTLAFLFAGVFRVTTLALSYFTAVAELLILPASSLKKYGGGSKKAWAIVTGASDGIGREYTLQLAKKGFNVGLVSRTESKLVKLKEEIESKYKVQVRYLAFDASSDVPANYSALDAFAKSLGDVTVLINNVGLSHSMPVPFLETEEKELRDIITINNVATLKFTQIVTPYILDSRKRGIAKRGLILTMGSFAGLTPTPLLATYSGSKAFLQAWNNAIAQELAPQGVDTQIVLSYLVVSAMSKVRRTSMLIPNPKQFVNASLACVGRRGGAQDRYATSTPYWSHGLYHWLIENTFGVFSGFVAGINYKMHVDIRRRALRKLEKQK